MFDIQLFLKLGLETRREAGTTDIVAQQFPAGNHTAESYQFPNANTRHDTELPGFTLECVACRILEHFRFHSMKMLIPSARSFSAWAQTSRHDRVRNGKQPV